MHNVHATATFAAALSLTINVTFAASVEPALAAMKAEIIQSLKSRDVLEKFNDYQAHTATGLDNTANHPCRLAYFDWAMRHQLDAPAEAETFTRQLHQSLSGDGLNLSEALAHIAKKLNTEPPVPRVCKALSAEAAIACVESCLAASRKEWQAAIAPLSAEQVAQLRTSLYALSTAGITGGASSWPDHAVSRQMCDTMSAMNRRALLAAAAELAPLADPRIRLPLSEIEKTTATAVDGASGDLFRLVETASGKILIGGAGDNIYELDTLTDIAVVIDIGGNDTYIEGVVTETRPLLVVMDLDGDDLYKGAQPGIQGSAIIGVSMLVDFAGNDKYDAEDVAQGTCLAGIGILVDFAGTDSYRAKRRAHGSATGGVGILIDSAGDDSYHASLYAQGFGGPLGFGLIDDAAGNDHYYAGGINPDSYGDSPGYAGWSQGMGAGPRGIANGGIGVMLDGGGDDVYECDYFSHGAAYWFAVGLARDFDGNDQRLGSTVAGFDGGARSEARFLRYGVGFGVHYGVGLLFDDNGNDTYVSDHAGPGFAYDISLGGIFDFGGDDTYSSTGIGQGAVAENGFAILFSVGGNDHYEGGGQAGAGPGSPGNFGFLIDYEGTDTYGNDETNDVFLECTSPTGFLIDRSKMPTDELPGGPDI
jgi:hypothetical protein